ncbi:MAG: LuxR C-terminal-related transcriptional regulator [Rhodospirillales bacterium]
MRRFAAVLAADVVGFSRSMEADEEATLARLKRLFGTVVEPAVAGHHGRVVKTTGDGILAEFPSAGDAVRCAVRLHRRDGASPDDDDALRLRVGISIGDVIADGSDIFGDTVNVAARLERLAEPGGILVTEAVRRHADGKADARFEDLGERRLRNVSAPVAVCRVIAEAAAVRALPAPALAPGMPTVAVLPFRAISREDEHALRAEGMTEDVTTRLAHVPGFFVVARYSTAVYGEHAPDLRAIADELGVRYVVEGSLRPIERRLRLNARLSDAAAGGVQLWSGQYDIVPGDPESAEDEIIRAIVGRLGYELTLAEVRVERARQPADRSAWSHMRLAYAALVGKGWNEDSFDEAAMHCRNAIAVDPDFALARAAHALTLALGKRFAMIADPDTEALALSEIDRAVALAPGDSEVLGFAGCALSDVGYLRRGISVLERAIEADPSNPQAWAALGSSLFSTGDVQGGIARLRHGIRLSPRDARLAVWQTFLGAGYLIAGNFDDACAEAEAARARDDRFYPAHIVMAAGHLESGRRPAAHAAMAEARRIRPVLTFTQAELWIGRRLAAALHAFAPDLLPQAAGGAAADAAPPLAGLLTPREREVLALVARGLANPAIAAALGLSGHTVKRHVANILGKLDLTSRAAAAALAARHGLS